ncbi:MAG: alpha-amylase [Acidobacteriia bacterium]|nr:alpha-amylase [Terriglobia bacterium]
MSFADTMLSQERPEAVRQVALPRRTAYHPSPSDWADQVIYFLLPDRFSDGQEGRRPMLDLKNPRVYRPDHFEWKTWAESGGGRFQGGTLKGITSKLVYLRGLGVTTLWIGPVFKNRTHWDSYHGYAIQDFLEVDPRLGDRQDLVELIAQAHRLNMYVLLDVVFNHTGDNWLYATGEDQPRYLDWPQFYSKGPWRDRQGGLTTAISTGDDGVWPRELQREEYYTRAGEGNLGQGSIDDPHAEFRRTDFIGDRDINYDGTQALNDLARCYKYWIALTDCDGFRIDTLKHVDQATGRNFCGTVKEYAASLGKINFFLVGEVAGADSDAQRYLKVLGSNLSATLDLGETKLALRAVAKGFAPPSAYLGLLRQWKDELGSHRNSIERHVTVLDDHDNISGEKIRFSFGASNDHQVVAGVAIQLFSLGIPCIYYGSEQCLAGAEPGEEKWLPAWGSNDEYLREAMFGPEHPRLPGLAGLPNGSAGLDASEPGFGPSGTAGAHCFNPRSPAYVRIAALIEVREQYPVLRHGRQYQRQIAKPGEDFALPAAGQLIAWSRILDDEEALCIVNGNGKGAQSADVVVDADLNSPSAPGNPFGGAEPFFVVIANSAQAAAGAGYSGLHPVGERVTVRSRNGAAYLEIRDVMPSEVLVLTNRV